VVRAVEGPLGYVVDLAGVDEGAFRIEQAATLAAMVQDEQAMMGASPHVLAVGRVDASSGGPADGA
jgi:hypothetical protein